MFKAIDINGHKEIIIDDQLNKHSIEEFCVCRN